MQILVIFLKYLPINNFNNKMSLERFGNNYKSYI